jgi:Flp pilus assembly pilin Flp
MRRGGNHGNGSARNRIRDERGVALTEFALVLPLLMILLMGMLDLGKAFNYWIDTTHLANLGARWAAVNKWPGQAGGTSLQQAVWNAAETGELKNGGSGSIPANPRGIEVCVTIDDLNGDGNAQVGEAVEVRVSTPYRLLPFLGNELSIPLPVDIDGTATMRIEQTPTYTAGCF